MREAPFISSARTARLQDSTRIRQRNWRSDGLPQVPGVWFFVLLAGLYLSLLYKIPPLGVALIALLAASLALLRHANWRIEPAMAVLTLGYAALATVTAFMVSFKAGIFRSVEFALLSAAAMAITIYVRNLAPQARSKLMLLFVAVHGLVLSHVIYFHNYAGFTGTWKYLEDTKFIFTAMVLILFYYEDELRRISQSVWFGAMAIAMAVIIISGERKALMFMVLAFFLSRASLWLKGVLLVLGACLVLIPGNTSLDRPDFFPTVRFAGEGAEAPSNRFFLVRRLIDHSDETRFFVNRNAKKLFEANPFFGLGATGYSSWSLKTYGSVAASGGLSMNVHGERYRIPVENGWFGIIWVAAFVATATVLVCKHVAAKGGLASCSRDRAPAYAFAMLLTYCYSEALDSTMVLMILLVGLWIAGLGQQLPRHRNQRPIRRRPRPDRGTAVST